MTTGRTTGGTTGRTTDTTTDTQAGGRVRRTADHLADGREIIYFDDTEPFLSGAASRAVPDTRPLEPALGGINAALRGGLSSGLTARALYYRGLVYRKQGSPGHAISDLTRALDYDGLSEQERSDAMEARTAAYQEAGVADQEVVVISPTSGGGGKGPSQPPPQTTAAGR